MVYQDTQLKSLVPRWMVLKSIKALAHSVVFPLKTKAMFIRRVVPSVKIILGSVVTVNPTVKTFSYTPIVGRRESIKFGFAIQFSIAHQEHHSTAARYLQTADLCYGVSTRRHRNCLTKLARSSGNLCPLMSLGITKDLVKSGDCLERLGLITLKPMADNKFQVGEREFNAAMRKLISTPASAKEGIKPTKARKKSLGRSKAPRRP